MEITLKAARVNAGMTQEDAAMALNISVSTYIKWEKNPGSISALKQKEISDLFKMSINNINFLSRH